MSKDAGCTVKTKTGKIGRTYYREPIINNKLIVHITTDEGKIVKMLCDPETVKIIGYID